MEIVFFIADPVEAKGVASSDDLPGDVAAEPMTVDGPGALLGLAEALGAGSGPAVRQLRDATCQSFPVWAIAEPLCEALASMSDERLDEKAEAWKPHDRVDLYERASCLTELRDALRLRDAGERLFALFEERAF